MNPNLCAEISADNDKRSVWYLGSNLDLLWRDGDIGGDGGDGGDGDDSGALDTVTMPLPHQ